MRSSGPDGGRGRNTSLPHTSKRRITTTIKTKHNQNCQENQTAWNSNNQGVKETFIQTGGKGEDGGTEDTQQGKAVDHTGKVGLADWVGSHITCRDTRKCLWGVHETTNPKGSVQETKDSKPLAVKTVGVALEGETPSLTVESVRKAHGVLKHTQTHPHTNQHLQGQDPLVGSKGGDRKWSKG